MKFSITGREECDLLIQVTAWAGLTVYGELLLFLLLIQVECQATNFSAISLCEHVTFDT